MFPQSYQKGHPCILHLGPESKKTRQFKSPGFDILASVIWNFHGHMFPVVKTCMAQETWHQCVKFLFVLFLFHIMDTIFTCVNPVFQGSIALWRVWKLHNEAFLLALKRKISRFFLWWCSDSFYWSFKNTRRCDASHTVYFLLNGKLPYCRGRVSGRKVRRFKF